MAAVNQEPSNRDVWVTKECEPPDCSHRQYCRSPLGYGLSYNLAYDEVNTKQHADEAQTPHTAETFVTKWPLYTPFEMAEYRPPERISFDCDFPKCLKETTWVRTSLNQRPSALPIFWDVHYQCSLCQKQNLVVLFREQKFAQKWVTGPSGQTERDYSTQVVKIGQYPALSITIPKTLQTNLGEMASGLYKKSLVCRNTGYGLVAVTYVRRVVEDKTDELIEVVCQLAESHNVESKIIEQIRNAKNERTTYDNKLKIAATVLPKSLIIDGVNPLGQLYSLVSAGVHDLTEEECIAVADDTKSVFEFTFSKLRAEMKERQEFVAKVKKWAGGKGPKNDGSEATG